MKRSELHFVRRMFDTIAPYYDFLNRLLSLRQDVYWRRALVSALVLRHGTRVLDAACGTADVGLEILRQHKRRVQITGIDFAPQMLRLAHPKIERARCGACITLAAADAFHLPFPEAAFEAATMAFGIRNIQDKRTVLAEFHRVLKPGGQLAILELGTPTQPAMQLAYRTYFNHMLPLVGRVFSKHRFAYSYLPESVARFPSPPQFSAIMRNAGFENIRYRPLTYGITVLFLGIKPQ